MKTKSFKMSAREARYNIHKSTLPQHPTHSPNRYNKLIMAHHLEAIYEQGILRPLEPLAQAENQRVLLTLEESPVLPDRETTDPVNERREELRWLASESAPHA